MSSKRGLVSIVIAGALHVPLFVFARAVTPAAPPTSSNASTEIDIAYEAPAKIAPDLAKEEPHDDPSRDALQGAIASREIGARDSRARGLDPSQDVPAPATSAAENAGNPENPGESWSFDPMRPRDVTSRAFTGRAIRDSLPPPEPEAENVPRGASTTGGLVESLDAHDRELGLGRGGPVLTALENAAGSTEDAPLNGSATFAVTIDTGGHISVSVLSVSSEMGAWQKVAGAAVAALDPKVLRIPPGARGIRVVAHLEAKVQYPNGLDPRSLGVHGDASLGHATETRDHIAIDKVPGVSVAIVGKVCTVKLSLDMSLTPISGGCDPSNAGTVPLRVVHGHIVNEERL